MVAEVSTATRTEVLGAIRGWYREASKGGKTRMLDEFVALTGCHKKHAVRLLGRSAEPVEREVPRGRRIYDEAVRQALIVVWEASDRICGKRLKAALPSMVESLERQRSSRPGPRCARAAGLGERQYHGPAAQTGERAGVCSGWTEAVPLLAREQSLVVEGLEAISNVFPVPVRGIDSDNDSVFINETLVGYCEENEIEFTRSRAYRKNDQAWVEQKNGSGDPALRWTRAPFGSGRRPDDGPPLRCCASVRELLPAILPTADKEPEWRQRDQALQQANDTLRPAARS